MKKRSHAIVCALGLATIFLQVTSAAAQRPDHTLIRVGFGGGFSVPTSNAGDVLDNGFNGQAYLLIDPGVGMPFRFNIGYQKFDFKDSFAGPASESTILSGIGGLTLDLVPIGPVWPYLTAGVGAFNVKRTIDGISNGSSESNTRFGIDVGAGLKLAIGRLDAFIEGRVQNVYTDEGVIESNSIRSIPVTFGILF
jgi:opacity protein-like surface antigen